MVLDFPYKDCYLQGGQDKEDQKREEIFYHETIANDEVTRMLAPKVFTNAKRYTKEGIEENIEFKDDDNLIIKGNNLIALSSLLKRYEGKVKLIYIDPPYNTGSDSFRYNDSFNHSTWLTFMKNRLDLAKKLLADDGSIYVQIDNNEVHYLKVLMDDVFGESNFQREIIWVLKGVSGYKSLVNNYVRGHDTILFFTKSKDFIYNKQYLPYSDEQLKRFSSVDEDGRKYKTITKTRRMYLDEAKGVPLTDVWDDIASFQTIVNSPEITGFNTQKPERLIKRIIDCSSNKGDLILDFNLGSGTTAAVAHKMERKYIGIEQMDYINEVTIPRLKRVIEGDKSGISEVVDWQGGGSFVYCELLENSKELIDEIQNATDATITDIKEKIYRDERIVPYITRDELEAVDVEFEKLTLEEKKMALCALVDKNKLYVNLSDIDDKEYNISDKDRKFTESFYKREV
ncbi:site-specific DNA-methyltransferase [Haloimpatiens lingqiaonensis]|uniref:site-specific DNA-methyltransferase n=1 Tax=Haloimpatiens lingqiaonensis TaxID=1380675 RepID=UPI0037C150AE